MKTHSHGPAAPRRLVILLHGVGADGEDLLALAPHMEPALPDTAFLAPDAPFPCDMAPFGHQWFTLLDRSPEAMAQNIRATAPLLEAFIDEALSSRGLTEGDLALVGFSQGTMMALHVAPRRATACAGVVGFSGAVVDASSLAGELRCRPRTLLIHGAEDDVVNPACLAQAERDFSAVGIPVLASLRPDLGHSIDGPGLDLAIGFLRQVFALDPS